MTLFSLTDYKSNLSKAEVAVLYARDALTKAQTEHTKTQDPNVFFTDQERAFRADRALPALLKAESDAEKAAEEAVALATDVVAVTENPVPSLSPADEAVAASRAVFVKEDVATMTLDALVGRIRQAGVENDPATLYLYWRYGRNRLNRGDGDTLADDATPRDPGTVPFPKVQDGAPRAELTRLIAEIAERFRSPEMKALYDRAVKLRLDAMNLRNVATKRQRSQQTYSFQTPNEVAW